MGFLDSVVEVVKKAAVAAVTPIVEINVWKEDSAYVAVYTTVLPTSAFGHECYVIRQGNAAITIAGMSRNAQVRLEAKVRETFRNTPEPGLMAFLEEIVSTMKELANGGRLSGAI